MLQLNGLSKQSPCRCCGNFTASHWISMLSCYLMVSVVPSSDLCFESTLCYHPRHNAVGHGPPVSPNVFSARRGRPQPSSSCEQAPVVGRPGPRAPSWSYHPRQPDFSPSPYQRGVFHCETQEPRQFHPGLRESLWALWVLRLLLPYQHLHCPDVVVRPRCRFPTQDASWCMQRDLGSGM